MIVRELDLQRLQVRLIGCSPLLTKRFSEESKSRIRAKQAHQPMPSRKAEPRDPEAEFQAAIYRAPTSGRPGIPAWAFEAACRQAAPYANLRRPLVKAAVRMEGGILVIDGPPPTLHESPVTLATGVQDFTYRPLYWPWAVRLSVVFLGDRLSAEQVINLLNTAGFSVGVGEGRPMSKHSHANLNFGTFRVDTEAFLESV